MSTNEANPGVGESTADIKRRVPEPATFWTEERLEQLKQLWEKGLTASQIVEQLGGGISRNAVIGKAHRLGLKSRPSPMKAGETAARISVSDPIVAALGHSVIMDDVLGWKWPSGDSYLSKNVETVLAAAESLAPAVDGRTVIAAVDVLRALLAVGVLRTSSPFIGRLRESVVAVHVPDSQAEAVMEVVRNSRRRKSASVLRWDVVQVLAEASMLRHRTNISNAEIGLRHLFAAFVRTRAGQVALQERGLLSDGFDALRRRAINALEPKHYDNYGDRVDAWRELLDELLSQPPLIPPPSVRTSYASDRVDVGSDSLGAAEDARALADLILLDAAKPPLAVGLFGSWGSGKSTLMAHLQREIARQAAEERDEASAGIDDPDAGTARVRNVVQLEFNAWTFADSANLWASFASEIFDQLAAGGIDGAARDHGARLVSEVAGRTSREAALLRTATAAVEEGDRGVAAARAGLEDAKLEAKAAITDAAMQTALALLGKGDAKDKALEDEGALQLFRRTVVGDTVSAEVQARRYAEAGTDFHRWLLMLFDFAWRARRWRTLFAVGAVLIALACLIAASLGSLQIGWAPVIIGLGGLSALARIALPTVKVAAQFSSALRTRKAAAREKVNKAEAELRAKEAALEVAEQQKRSSAAFVAQYGDLREGAVASSPGLMLEYLLKESEGVATIRKQMGLLAVVRRCFDQLNAVVKAMRAKDGGGVERIVLYVDDLDRCNERQVVEILQAVHLLLAYECFVVVVAVDAAWLKRSLESQYTQLAGDDPNKPTAADYLEKIFQIPFWVRSLSTSADAGGSRLSYQRYVTDLLNDYPASEAPADAVPERKRDSVDRTVLAFTLVEPTAPAKLDMPRQERLSLTELEKELLADLGELAAKSPRAVKRMVNLYRLMRVSYRGEELERFLQTKSKDGFAPFYAVQLALACEVGLRCSTVEALRGSVAEFKPLEWSDYASADISTIDPFASEDCKRVRAILDREGKANAFERALDRVQQLKGGIPLQQDEFLAAFNCVERYSFRARSWSSC